MGFAFDEDADSAIQQFSIGFFTGEETGGDMLGADPAADATDMAEPDAMNTEPDMDASADTAADDFATAEPAAGGIETDGREKRESIDFSSKLLKTLAG